MRQRYGRRFTTAAYTPVYQSRFLADKAPKPTPRFRLHWQPGTIGWVRTTLPDLTRAGRGLSCGLRNDIDKKNTAPGIVNPD